MLPPPGSSSSPAIPSPNGGGTVAGVSGPPSLRRISSSTHSGHKKAAAAVELSPDELIRSLQRLAPNKKCADCGAKLPSCVNLTIGSFVCLVCAGIHRELNHKVKGVGHSRFTKEEADLMQQSDNDQVNAKYLALHKDGLDRNQPPNGNSDPQRNKAWILRKYKDKAWCRVDKNIVHDSKTTFHKNSSHSSNSNSRRAEANNTNGNDSYRREGTLARIPSKSTPTPTPTPEVDLWGKGGSVNGNVDNGNEKWDAFGKDDNFEFSADFASALPPPSPQKQQQQQQMPLFEANFATDFPPTPQLSTNATSPSGVIMQQSSADYFSNETRAIASPQSLHPSQQQLPHFSSHPASSSSAASAAAAAPSSLPSPNSARALTSTTMINNNNNNHGSPIPLPPLLNQPTSTKSLMFESKQSPLPSPNSAATSNSTTNAIAAPQGTTTTTTTAAAAATAASKHTITPATYSAGQIVYYRSTGHGPGSGEAQVLKVHWDDELVPYYTIRFEGKEKQTDDAHLSSTATAATSIMTPSSTVHSSSIPSKKSELQTDIERQLSQLTETQLEQVQEKILQLLRFSSGSGLPEQSPQHAVPAQQWNGNSHAITSLPQPQPQLHTSGITMTQSPLHFQPQQEHYYHLQQQQQHYHPHHHQLLQQSHAFEPQQVLLHQQQLQQHQHAFRQQQQQQQQQQTFQQQPQPTPGAMMTNPVQQLPMHAFGANSVLGASTPPLVIGGQGPPALNDSQMHSSSMQPSFVKANHHPQQQQVMNGSSTPNNSHASVPLSPKGNPFDFY